VATKALTYKIGADLGQLRRELEGTDSFTRKAKRELRDLEERQRAHRQSLSDLGAGMLTFGAAAAIGMGLAVREAVKWESAFAGVRKTVDGSDEEIAALEGELRGLARTLPATHQEIAAVAEAAGQLGIKRQDIAEFTKTMVDLGETTNLTAEEAATALAKFANIMGTSASDVDRLGSALVALGNDGASTEKDIIEMGLRIAGAGRQIGLTESQVLAFASSLSSVGIEAEAGGSSFSGVMIKMSQAANDGGERLDTFAKVAGMSSAKFATAFKKDAAGAIITFIQGLGKMQASGQDVFGVLDELGLSEIRVRDALLRASGAADLFTNSLKTGSDAWAENQALADEAAKRYETTEAQLQIAGNNIKDAMIDVGAALVPILQAGLDVVQNLITAFQNLPGPVKDVVAVVGAATAAVAVLGGAALIATPKLLAFRESMRTMADSGGKMSGALGKFGLFMAGPWGAALGLGVTLLGALGVASGAAQERQKGLAEAGKRVAEAIDEQNGAITESVRADTAKALAEEGVLQIAKELGIALPDVTDAVLDQGTAYDDLTGKLKGIIDAKQAELDQAKAVRGNNAEVERLEGEIEAYEELLNGIDGVKGGKEAELLAQEAAAEGAKKGAAANKENAASAEEVAMTAEEAAAALDSMVDALERLNGVTLSHREAQRNLVQVVGEANALFKDNAKTLNIHTADGMENAEMLDSVASAMNDAAEAAAKEAEATGGAAAGQSALVASLQASRTQLFNMSRQFFATEEATWAYVDSVLAIPAEATTAVITPGSKQAQSELARVKAAVEKVPPKKEVNVGVLSQSAIKKLQDLGFKVRTLPDGSVSVSANTASAQNRLNDLVRKNNHKVLSWTVRVHTQEVGRQSLAGRFTPAYGGVVAFAQGGMFGESHHPQIGRAVPGAVRIWAEPETGNESYIPWAMDRRGRATDILGITADAFGYTLVPKSTMVQSFAHGGVNGGGASSGGWGAVNVRVFVGDREIHDIVRVELDHNNRQTRRDIIAGRGRAR
jgi:TP901 family phage tail tape measure protein